jgi:hypothetical protein
MTHRWGVQFAIIGQWSVGMQWTLGGGVGGVLTAVPDVSHTVAWMEMLQEIGYFEAQTLCQARSSNQGQMRW